VSSMSVNGKIIQMPCTKKMAAIKDENNNIDR